MTHRAPHGAHRGRAHTDKANADSASTDRYRGDSSFDDLEPELKQMWEAKHPETTLDWLKIREAYRFGWTMARLPEYASVDWARAEPDLSQHWHRPQLPSEESAWDYVRPAVQEGWHQSRRYRDQARHSS